MMTARRARVAVSVALFAVFLWAGMLAGQTSPEAGNSKPANPKPSLPVEKLLDEASSLAGAKKPEDSLKAAQRALDVARQSNDKPGAALSEQARARALQDLERPDEAFAAWQSAAQIWAEAGNAPQQITALVQAGLLPVKDNKDEAAQLFAQALSVAKSDSDHPLVVAQTLYDYGNILAGDLPSRGFGKPIDKRRKQTASDYLRTSLAMREQHAPGSVELVETLNALARLTLDHARDTGEKGDYSLAKGYSARAFDLGQRLAPDSPIVVESLRSLSRAERQLFVDGVDARSHCLKALQIQRKLAPGGSPEEIEMLGFLGGMEQDLSHLSLARLYLEQAVTIGDRLAPDSREFEYALEVLGVLEVNEGDPSAARDHLQRALAIREKAHAAPGTILLYLGAVADDQGDFAAARDYFQKELSFLEETSPNAPEIAVTLENLGQVFDRQGDFVSALEYSRRALAFAEQKEGESPNTARCLGEVGNVLRDQGKFTEAAEYYKKTLALWEKLVPDSLDVAYSLNLLSTLARAQGNLDLAADYDRRALEMGQKSCPNFWCVIDIMVELGELAYEKGDLAGSEDYLTRALNLREKSLGSMHPLLAGNLNDLALVFAAQGKANQALADALRAEKIGAEHLRVSARTLSERQALAYEGVRGSGLDLALTLAGDRASTPLVRSQVFETVIHSRALVFDELAARHRSAYGSGDPEIKQLADQLSSTRTRLATLVFRGPGDSDPAAYRQQLGDAREQKEKAERQLAEKSAVFRQDQARAQFGFKDISSSLPKGAALVAYVRFARHQFQPAGTGKQTPKPVPSYAAFVLRTGTTKLEFVPLGKADEIERLITTWRRTIVQEAEVATGPGNSTEDAYRRAGSALRRKIWDPLVPQLGNTKEVFVVPDAALHLVNMSSLPVGNASYLIETGPLVHYLSTERDLAPTTDHHGSGILVVGNPSFDQPGKLLAASDQPPAPSRAVAGTTANALRGSRSVCGTFQKLHFPALPASQQEAENIAALWNKSNVREQAITMRGSVPAQKSGELLQLTGSKATLETFEQSAPGKRVLHVATHGFFLEDSCESAAQQGVDVEKRDGDVASAWAENPLLLSGLAFAGANQRSSAKNAESDGILTAEEIAGMNLEGVDWAVLSACSTGSGEIRVGEGVFGLRRAFQVAGAKTVIMSLWQVEDETARQWMGTLYREHFLHGKDTAESVRTASLRILQQRRSKQLSTDPFYWAAFIAAGDWH